MSTDETWRDILLREFAPGVNRLTLAHDPDGMLADELLVRELHARGFAMLVYDDPIVFRSRYESEFRARADAPELIVVTERAPDALPWDIVCAGRRVMLDLGAVFPGCSVDVLRELDGDALARLHATQRATSEPLGDAATCDLVLRSAYDVDVHTLRRDADVLRVLLRLHMRGMRMPRRLAQRMAEHAASTAREWDIAGQAVDAGSFFEFLQERWPRYVDERLRRSGVGLREPRASYGLRHPGPSELPFDDVDVRVYIDDLFLDGRLMPAPMSDVDADVAAALPAWMRVGVAVDAAEEQRRRGRRRIDAARDLLPGPQAPHGAWAVFAQRRAEAAAVAPNDAQLAALDDEADRRFAAWLEERYGGLASLPPLRPVLVSHVARCLAQQLEADPALRTALVVVDGMALEQWCVLRDCMSARDAGLRFDERALFAWIPTLTSVSRQAIFAGAAPFAFPGSIDRTSHEPKLWRAFWRQHGIAGEQVGFAKGLGDGDAVDDVRRILEEGASLRVLGLVVDDVDRIMHGMTNGAAGMLHQVRQWAEGGYMNELVTALHAAGFRVWLVADHGNIACRAGGAVSDGVWAEERGARVRVYASAEMRTHVAQKISHARAWTPGGLPPGYHPLYAEGTRAFAAGRGEIVAHGGRSVREVIVPFVEVGRRTE